MNTGTGLKRGKYRTASGRVAGRLIIPVDSSEEDHDQPKKAKSASGSEDGSPRPATPDMPPVVVPSAPASMPVEDARLAQGLIPGASVAAIKDQLSPVVTLAPRINLAPVTPVNLQANTSSDSSGSRLVMDIIPDVAQDPDDPIEVADNSTLEELVFGSQQPVVISADQSEDSDVTVTMSETARREAAKTTADDTIIIEQSTDSDATVTMSEMGRRKGDHDSSAETVTINIEQSEDSDATVTMSEMGRREAAQKSTKDSVTVVDSDDVDLFDEALGVSDEDKRRSEGE